MRTLTQAGLMTAFLAAATAAGAQPPFSIVTGFKAQQTVTPNTLLLASDGNFYGTTSFGGTFDKGTLFRVSPGGIVTVLHDFTGGNEGAWPLNLIQASDGDLYGPSYEGGDGCGTIFRATLSGTVTTLHTFPISSAGYPDGCGPNSLVEAFDGNLYRHCRKWVCRRWDAVPDVAGWVVSPCSSMSCNTGCMEQVG